MRVSTRSWICGSGRVFELTASVRIGVSAGLTLRYRGGAGMPSGSRLSALSSADCTSCSATPRSLSSANCSVMTETPAPLAEDICLRPEIWPR